MTKQERLAHKQRMDAIRQESIRIVSTGICPQCGTELRRNSSIAGWWQCDCYGMDQFRKPENRGKPSCSFQCFTE